MTIPMTVGIRQQQSPRRARTNAQIARDLDAVLGAT
jgi:hypothetical protein